MEHFKTYSSFKLSKMAHLLNSEYSKNKVSRSVSKQLDVGNVCFYNGISNIFSVRNCSLSYIELWFSSVAENKSFLDMNLNQLKRVIASSELNITTELEVVNSVDSWIKHDQKERMKFAIELIQNIRLYLLPDHALRNLLTSEYSFSECQNCKVHLKKSIENKKKQSY